MAVFNRCSCKTFNSTSSKLCKSCGKKLTKDYYIQYTVDGKRKTEKVGNSIGYAREVLAKRMIDIREGKFFGTIKSIHWKHFFDGHYRRYCENNLSHFDETRFTPARDFKLFDKPMHKITRTDIEEYRASLENGKRAKSTINRYMQVVKFAFNYAESLDLIDRNPARKLIMYKEEPTERTTISVENEKLLLEESKESKNRLLYHFIMISLYTGMRYREVLSLKWSHVSMEMQSIRLYKTKSNEIREIPIIPILKPVIEDIHSLTSGYEYVFTNPDTSERIVSLKGAFEYAVKRSNIPRICIHEMRHTMVTRLAASGASVPEIQQISGHKTAKMVQRYTHVGLKEARRTIDRLNDFLKG